MYKQNVHGLNSRRKYFFHNTIAYHIIHYPSVSIRSRDKENAVHLVNTYMYI